MHHLGSIVLYGNIRISPFALHRCAADGRSVVLMDEVGRFKARLEGPLSGNVLLRRAQHSLLSDSRRILEVARCVVAGKIHNCRNLLLRSSRESDLDEDRLELKTGAEALGCSIQLSGEAEDLDILRGIEGQAAKTYFEVFHRMVRTDRESFKMNGRSRRPPRDRMNAMLSFLYALLLNECVSALESVGLDPQVGFFHALRPGRPALALDLMEELRPLLGDRVALSLINRGQVRATDFEERPGGAVSFSDDARKEVVKAFQQRKQEEITHPVLGQKMPWGLVSQIQARLLARWTRSDLASYSPFIPR
jgi:CRISP-associated protein Cas1